MSKGVAGAIAVILLWMSFAMFFVAFHPGGIRSDVFKSDNNPQGYARNPRDVFLYFVNKVARGYKSPGGPLWLRSDGNPVNPFDMLLREPESNGRVPCKRRPG